MLYYFYLNYIILLNYSQFEAIAIKTLYMSCQENI